MQTVELESSPSLSGLYARAAIGGLVPGGGGEALPEREYVLRGARIDPGHVAEYARVCGFGLRDSVPGTYPHVLAFPLHVKLMTDPSFPFGVLGMVHVANRIEVLEPLSLGASIDLRLHAEGLRPHRRGRQFDMVVEAQRDGTAVWRAASTYLRREKSGPGSRAGEDPGFGRERAATGAPARADREEGSRAGLSTSALWTIPGDIGRRYASVSGDRNPIHMHALSARALGFPGAIAHGMWTKARCLAAFEGRLGDAYAIEVEFKAPLRIPGRARLLTAAREGGWRFAVESPGGERSHAGGAIST